jgi:hypothetical protein
VVAATLVPDQGGAMLPSERMIRRIVQRSPAPRLTLRKPDSVMPVARRNEAVEPFTDRLSPSWVKKSPAGYAENDSFLSDQGVTASNWAPFTHQDLIETSSAASMRQTYQDLNRQYEVRAASGLLGTEDLRNQMTRMRDFSREVFREVSRFQTKKARRTLKRAAERDPILRSQPVVVAGTLTSVYFDNPVEFSLSDEARVSARTSIPDQTGNVQVYSPIVDGRFELDGHADDGLAPGTVPSDPTFKREKYRFSVSRPVGILDITSGVSYGSTTTQLSTSLTKPISDHVTCVLDSVRPMDAPGAASEERVRFLYGIRF